MGQCWHLLLMAPCGDGIWWLLTQYSLRNGSNTAGVQWFCFHRPQCVGCGVTWRERAPGWIAMKIVWSRILWITVLVSD
jgi:hypothetical protein